MIEMYNVCVCGWGGTVSPKKQKQIDKCVHILDPKTCRRTDIYKSIPAGTQIMRWKSEK
jgi:hypothetical protein